MKEEHRNGGDFDFLIGKSIKKLIIPNEKVGMQDIGS